MNTQREQAKSETRMVHIRLNEDTHKKLRVRAAEADMTIQDWVADAIKAKLNGRNKANKSQDD